MEKLFFWLSFSACILSTVWGITNRLNRDSKSINPMSENIDKEAFMEQHSVDDADVIRFFDEVNKIGDYVQLKEYSFVAVLRRRCEDGPIRVMHREESTVAIFPIPFKNTCNASYCKDFDCLARAKKRVCQWGLQYTTRLTTERSRKAVFLGIKRVCYETHLKCGCKTCKDFKTPKECNNVTSCPNSILTTISTFPRTSCYWVNPVINFEPLPTVSFKRIAVPFIPISGRCSCCTHKSCRDPYAFNRTTCKCECPPKPECNATQFYNLDKCQCDCDPNQKCPSPKILDLKTCQCKCPNDSIEDEITGNCTGSCEQFHGSDNCVKIFCKTDPTKLCGLINRKCECPKNVSSQNVSSCEEILDPDKCNQTVCPGTNRTQSIMCKFYHNPNPSTNRTGCHCDNKTKKEEGCCMKKLSAPQGTNCDVYNTIGSKECNSASQGEGCEWVCDCKNIRDAKVCINSTCLSQPSLTCTYSDITGCNCPSCCHNHPLSNNVFDCASLHMLGSIRCNRYMDGKTCQWRCGCSDINDKITCLRSTCVVGNQQKRCRFNEHCFCKNIAT